MLRWSALGLATVTLCGCGGTTAPAAPTGRIDVHQHMIPETYRRWLATHGVLDVGGIAVPEWSASAAMASMDRTGTARALLSVSAPGVTPAATEAEAEDMARTLNDTGAELAKDHPDRFGFLATLPLPAVDAGAREATRALDELGADGRGEGESFPCNRALSAAIDVHDEPRALRLTGPGQQHHRLRGC